MAWWNTPVWALSCYMKMLAPLKAERQLEHIESVSVPHMKSDAVGRLVSRLMRIARREKPKSLAEQLMGAMKVIEEPTKE